MKRPISQLFRTEQEKVRQQWKQDQRKHRERKRAMEEILNFTAVPMDITPVELRAELQPNLPNTDRENIVSVDVEQPRASSTPQRVESSDIKWQWQKAKLCRKMHKMKRDMQAAKRESEKWWKCTERLRKKKSGKQKAKSWQWTHSFLKAKADWESNWREQIKDCTEIGHPEKEWVVDFFCWDENSRILPGTKDIVTKNKNKQQRHVLVKPFTELHLQYNSEMQKSHRLSYRQFVCPFGNTAKSIGQEHLCMLGPWECEWELLTEKLQQKGLLKTASISQLQSSTVIVDFSENFSCKLNSELQSFHFRGSRKQATVHTCGLHSRWLTVLYHHLCIPSAWWESCVGPLGASAKGCDGEMQSVSHNFTCDGHSVL